MDLTNRVFEEYVDTSEIKFINNILIYSRDKGEYTNH